MNPAKRKLALDRSATYEIRVPGNIEESWLSSGGAMKIAVENKDYDPSVTIITGTFDQAALQGLLRRLYSLGLPLISVTYIDDV